MTTLINARPRFGLEGDRLFDYLSSRYVPIGGLLQDEDGSWDTAKVAELIRNGSPIEAAFTPRDKVEQFIADFNAATPEPAEGDKVEQAKQDFLAYPKADVEGAMAAQEAPPKGD